MKTEKALNEILLNKILLNKRYFEGTETFDRWMKIQNAITLMQINNEIFSENNKNRKI